MTWSVRTAVPWRWIDADGGPALNIDDASASITSW
jgi:hypothetical protein